MLQIALLSAAHLHADSYVHQISHLPDAVLMGFWDSDPERLDRKAAEYGVHAFADRDDLLSRCDAVIICAENIHHRVLTEAAAAHQKHILCEKPLATTPDDARAMVDACANAGVQLMTAFPCRFSPAFEQMRMAIQRGDLGEILGIAATNRGKCPGGWFVDKSLSGGGAVMDHTVHVTDLLRVLLQSEAVEVYCEADNRIHHGDFDDSGLLTVTFANGVFATLDCSWSRPKTFPTWGDVTLSITGTGGVMHLDMFAQESVLYDDSANRIGYENWGSSIDAGMVAGWVRAITTGEPVPVSGEDGLRAVEVVEAAYESVRTGQALMVRSR